MSLSADTAVPENQQHADAPQLPDPLRAGGLLEPHLGGDIPKDLPAANNFSHSNTARAQQRAPAREEDLQPLDPRSPSAPVSRLPVELLGEVFMSAQDLQDPEDSAWHWSCVLRVCRLWRASGETTPKLWRNLKVVSSTNMLRNGLVHSKAVEVNIDIKTDAAMSEALTLIKPQCHRVRSLNITTVPEPRGPIPAPRALTVPGFNLEVMVDILRRLKDVEELVLNCITIPGNISAPTPLDADRPTLHKLRKLHLTLPPLVIRQFLHEIIIPPTADVNISSQSCTLNTTRPVEGEESIEHDEVYLPVLSKLVLARVCVSSLDFCSIDGYVSAEPNQSCRSKLGMPTPGHIYLEADFTDNALDLFGVKDPLSVLRDSPLENLRIECAGTSLPGVNWKDALLHFHKLRTLCVVVGWSNEAEPMDVKLIFAALEPSLDATKQVPCPDLQCLSILSWPLSADEAFRVLPSIASRLEARQRGLSDQHAFTELSLSVVGISDPDERSKTKRAYETTLGLLVKSFEIDVVAEYE
ncbi:hypothetical protein C2E23DRAFT_486786 [Lenzites betulinus]|nr:hypothetical protein C2E23DRAFT_486786 [Lenzites betulinus]